MKTSIPSKMRRLVGKAIGDFQLIEDGDRILVALSGGKDSWSLLYLLNELRLRAPVQYHLTAVTVDPGTGAFDFGSVSERLAKDGFESRIIPGNILQIIKSHLSVGTSPCSFCARLRRGVLYSFAASGNWNKIALGHHLDDFIETLLMNMFFNGSLKGMSPILHADDGKNTVIRPLVYVREDWTTEFARYLGVPIVNCACPFQGEIESKRHYVKKKIHELEQDIPDVKTNILSSMARVRPRHLLSMKNKPS
jgi:tRNA 2-thiocytidine biosynthesis protein TtcA